MSTVIEKALEDIACDISTHAGIVFNLGLKDGASGARIKNADEVMKALQVECPKFRTGEWRVFHTKKVRQIYGAGLDVAKAHRRITEK
jgi:hypothetical protein